MTQLVLEGQAIACMWCSAPTAVTADQGPYQGGRLLNVVCTDCGTPAIVWTAA